MDIEAHTEPFKHAIQMMLMVADLYQDHMGQSQGSSCLCRVI